MDIQNCSFCDPLRSWPEELVVGSLENSTVLLSEDQFFYGWCLVVANEHVVDLFDLTTKSRLALEVDVGRVTHAIQELFTPDKMNYAVFGNVTAHLHWNLIPRRKDDGLWGKGPWPHDERVLPRSDAFALAEKIRLKIGATL